LIGENWCKVEQLIVTPNVCVCGGWVCYFAPIIPNQGLKQKNPFSFSLFSNHVDVLKLQTASRLVHSWNSYSFMQIGIWQTNCYIQNDMQVLALNTLQ